MGTSQQQMFRVDDGTVAWRFVWRVGFAIVRRSGRILSALAKMRIPSYAREIVRLSIIGRSTGKPRPVVVAMLELDGRRYVGHPNGKASWIGNLGAMSEVTLTVPRQQPILVRPVPLPLGPERAAVIRAAAHHGPIHVRPLYWASRAHVFRAGIYFRLDPATPAGS